MIVGAYNKMVEIRLASGDKISQKEMDRKKIFDLLDARVRIACKIGIDNGQIDLKDEFGNDFLIWRIVE